LFGGDGATQRRILEPAQCEQRALDPSDFAQSRGEAGVARVGR
jgi:hypothetical protein